MTCPVQSPQFPPRDPEESQSKLTSIAAFYLERAQRAEWSGEMSGTLCECDERSDIRVIHQAYKRAQDRFLPLLKDTATHPTIGLAPTAFNVDHSIHHEGLRALVEECEVRLGGFEAFREMVDGCDLATTPATLPELVAWCISHSYLKGTDKVRVPVSDELRADLVATLAARGIDSNPRIGGISTYVAVLDTVFGGSPVMVSLGDPPAGAKELLGRYEGSSGIRALSEKGITPLSAVLDGDTPQAPHVAVSIEHESLFPDVRRDARLRVGGRIALASRPCSGEILITGAKSPPGFEGISPEHLDEFASSISGLLLSGLHRLQSEEEVVERFEELQPFRAIPVPLAFSTIRKPALIGAILERIANSGLIDSISMNTSESFELLSKIDSWKDAFPQLSSEFVKYVNAACRQAKRDKTSGREQAEWILDAAIALNDVLWIPVRVRAREIDVTVFPRELFLNAEELDDLQDITMVSRVVAAEKCALPTGAVHRVSDIGDLHVVPGKKTIDTHHAANRYLEARFGVTLGNEEGDSPRYWTKLPDGRYVLAIPTPLIGDRRGGTVSAGDVMDYVKFILALRHFQGRLIHPA